MAQSPDTATGARPIAPTLRGIDTAPEPDSALLDSCRTQRDVIRHDREPKSRRVLWVGPTVRSRANAAKIAWQDHWHVTRVSRDEFASLANDFQSDDERFDVIVLSHQPSQTDASSSYEMQLAMMALKHGGYLWLSPSEIMGNPGNRERPYRHRDSVNKSDCRQLDRLARRIGFTVLETSPRLLPIRGRAFHRAAGALSRAFGRGSIVHRRMKWPTDLPWCDAGLVGALLVAHKPWTRSELAANQSGHEFCRAVADYETNHNHECDRLATWLSDHGTHWWADQSAERVRNTLTECRSVLVLSPHPDDELIGCGGLMIDLVRRGAHVSVLHMTDGSASAALKDRDPLTRRTIRLDEARSVGAAMKLRHVLSLHRQDGTLTDDAATVRDLSNVFAELRPDVLLLPFVNDNHPDHRAANDVARAALRVVEPSIKPQILCYEVWSLGPPQFVYSIDNAAQGKYALLLQYKTPMQVVDYVWHCRVRDRHHSFRYLNRNGFAESFLPLSINSFLDLMERIRPWASATDPSVPDHGPAIVEQSPRAPLGERHATHQTSPTTVGDNVENIGHSTICKRVIKHP